MTTRFLLTVALATFMAVQGPHAECWFSCDASRPAAGLGCHQDGTAGPTLSDTHDCANHAPLVALTVERNAPAVDVAMAVFLAPAAPNAGRAARAWRMGGSIRSPGSADLPIPLRI